MTDYARAGDYEGVLTYGIGYTRAVLLSNPQTYVRAYEVEVVTAAGQHRYVVAIDINAAGTTKIPDADRRRVQASAAR